MVLGLFKLECLGLLAACVVAYMLCGSPGARRAWHRFGRLARRRWLCVALLGLFGFAGAASMSPLVSKPLPKYHDEFSYLLAADTFARGRLANPSHPLGVHFETFHVILEPTVASKYPPAQALVLAAGQVLGGDPAVGIWIGMGLCSAGLCWMLQGWLTPRWALIGALLFSGKLIFVAEYDHVVGYWAQSYWGGGVGAFGGALLFGAARRVVYRPAVGTSLALGVGLVILANCRPFEGLVISLPVAGLLFVWLVRRRAEWRRLAAVVCLPITLVLLAGAGAMAYYNVRVTGHPLRMPYVYHESIYAVAPSFIWQPMRPEPAYNHAQMRDLWVDWACEDYLAQRTGVSTLVRYFIAKVERLWFFFLGASLTLPLALLCLPGRSGRWFLFAAGCCALFVGVLLLHVGVQPHYAAPATALIAYLVTASLRRLCWWRPGGRAIGRAIAVGVVANYFLVMALSVAFAQKRLQPTEWYRERDRLARELRATPGDHLVIVHYTPDHVVDEEWVANEANIDTSRIIWARAMNPTADRRLLDYYPSRRVWRLDADSVPPKFVPYGD